MQSGLTRGSHGAGVVDIFAEIRAVIDSGDDEVGLVREELVERDDNAIGGRAVHGPVALGYGLTHDGLAESERLRRAAALGAWRHDADFGEIRESFRERTESRRVVAVIVREQNSHVAAV